MEGKVFSQITLIIENNLIDESMVNTDIYS